MPEPNQLLTQNPVNQVTGQTVSPPVSGTIPDNQNLNNLTQGVPLDQSLATTAMPMQTQVISTVVPQESNMADLPMLEQNPGQANPSLLEGKLVDPNLSIQEDPSMLNPNTDQTVTAAMISEQTSLTQTPVVTPSITQIPQQMPLSTEPATQIETPLQTVTQMPISEVMPAQNFDQVPANMMVQTVTPVQAVLPTQTVEPVQLDTPLQAMPQAQAVSMPTQTQTVMAQTAPVAMAQTATPGISQVTTAATSPAVPPVSAVPTSTLPTPAVKSGPNVLPIIIIVIVLVAGGAALAFLAPFSPLAIKTYKTADICEHMLDITTQEFNQAMGTSYTSTEVSEMMSKDGVDVVQTCQTSLADWQKQSTGKLSKKEISTAQKCMMAASSTEGFVSCMPGEAYNSSVAESTEATTAETETPVTSTLSYDREIGLGEEVEVEYLATDETGNIIPAKATFRVSSFGELDNIAGVTPVTGQTFYYTLYDFKGDSNINATTMPQMLYDLAAPQIVMLDASSLPEIGGAVGGAYDSDVATQYSVTDRNTLLTTQADWIATAVSWYTTKVENPIIAIQYKAMDGVNHYIKINY